jgi:hypothetical protein
MDVKQVPLPAGYQDLLILFFYLVSECGDLQEDGSVYIKFDVADVRAFGKDYLEQRTLIEMSKEGDESVYYRVTKNVDVKKILNDSEQETNPI